MGNLHFFVARTRVAPMLITVSLFALASVNAYSDVSGGYFYKSSSELDYLTVTKTSTKLSGYLQSVKRDLTFQAGVTVKQLRFDANVDGTQFSVRSEGIDRFFGGP